MCHTGFSLSSYVFKRDEIFKTSYPPTVFNFIARIAKMVIISIRVLSTGQELRLHMNIENCGIAKFKQTQLKFKVNLGIDCFLRNWFKNVFNSVSRVLKIGILL